MLVGFLFSIITNLGYSEAFKFQLYFFRSNFGKGGFGGRSALALRQPPQAGSTVLLQIQTLKGVLWRTTNLQRFGPHFGIRPGQYQTRLTRKPRRSAAGPVGVRLGLGVDRNLTHHFR